MQTTARSAAVRNIPPPGNINFELQVYDLRNLRESANDATLNYFISTGRVVTAPVFRSHTRMAWLLVSAMKSLSPQPERPLGSWKRTFNPLPFSSPFFPSPRRDFTARVLGSTVLILWL